MDSRVVPNIDPVGAVAVDVGSRDGDGVVQTGEGSVGIIGWFELVVRGMREHDRVNTTIDNTKNKRR